MMKRASELRAKAEKVEVLEHIYDVVLRDMHWNYYHIKEDEDGNMITDEHGENVYEPDADFTETYGCYTSKSDRCDVYKEVLKAIENIADKI